MTGADEKASSPKSWWQSLHIPVVHIPKLYTFLKWICLIVIAVSCALVGFFQSMIVSWLYAVRSQFIYRIVRYDESYWLKGLEYIGLNLCLAFAASFSLYLISPAATGSGIPDVKAFLNGVESPIWKKFFTVKTFIAKVVSSALAVSSSLAMGKEGPMLHAGSILAVILGSNKWMQQQMAVAAHWGVYTYNKELRDLVAVGVACGVTTAFKAPVGGVLFAMDLSTRWRKDLTIRCFLAAAITIVVVRLCVTACVKHDMCSQLKYGSLIWFQQNKPAPYQQFWAVIILAVIGGYLGCLFVSFNTWVCLVRKRWAKHFGARITEVCVISVFTSIFLYAWPTMGRCLKCTIDASSISPDGNCLGSDFNTFAGFHCTDPNKYNDMAVLVFNPQGFKIDALFTAAAGTFTVSTLALYSFLFWMLACITYGAFIPSGLFTPSLIFGGCFGRLFAEVLIWMSVPGIDPGMYALLGAAAFMGGLMRMSAAMALILMEMTQSPQQLPFLMLTLVVAKQVGDQFNYGVFEHQMMLKAFPFVGIDEEAAAKAKLSARAVMSQNDRNTTLYCVESPTVIANALEMNKELDAFPVTMVPEDEEDRGDFLGMISRSNLMAALEEHEDESENIDLSSKIEVAPIIIPPNMPLPFIYRIVNAEGFNHLPVIRYHGRLEGMISRQELVDIQNKKLDAFHLQEQMNQMSEDIEQGHLIKSMNLTDNIHAARFREGAQRFRKGALKFVKNPIKSTQEFLEEEDTKEEEQHEFFLNDMPTEGPSEGRRGHHTPNIGLHSCRSRQGGSADPSHLHSLDISSDRADAENLEVAPLLGPNAGNAVGRAVGPSSGIAPGGLGPRPMQGGPARAVLGSQDSPFAAHSVQSSSADDMVSERTPLTGGMGRSHPS